MSYNINTFNKSLIIREFSNLLPNIIVFYKKYSSKIIRYVNIGHGCKAPHCHNAHAFLCFGAIPELETPYYYELRNRVCKDGSEWLQPEMKAFMSCKLNEINKESHQKIDVMINWIYSYIYTSPIWARRILKKINKRYKSNEVRKL